MTKPPRGPVLFEYEDDAAPAVTPSTAPPVPDAELPADPAAMQRLAVMAARKPRPLARWFWGLLVACLTFFGGLLVWSAIDAILAANPLLGAIATALVVAFGLVCLVIVIREIAAFARLARLDAVQTAATQAIADQNLTEAKKIAARLADLYAHRPEFRQQRDEVKTRLDDVFDADAALGLVEARLLTPLDAAASREVEAAARQVATVTAIVPLALADVFVALTANMRMIRRIAEVYGGRSGTLGTWRLTRAVLTHIVATGAVAVGDDLIHSVAGGSLLTRVSRRFGEGVVNGALTARVGVAAIEVCRPLPFLTRPRPRVTQILQRALTGLFPTSGRGRDEAGEDGA